jgi:RHH-type transcriptional regulator, rel operon repressor / antitoxin RelB
VVASATLNVEVSETDKERLEALAQTTGRSESLLASEAISEYLALQEWQIAGTKAAIHALDRGEWVAHDAVRDWVSSWNSDSERDAPKPRQA